VIGEAQTLVLSDKTTVTIAELDGYESDRADLVLSKLIGTVDPRAGMPVMQMALLQMKVYALCSVRSINGATVSPLENGLEYAKAAKSLTIGERNKLQEWAQPLYAPAEDEIKNEPSVQP
jgi:hypothetical protein